MTAGFPRVRPRRLRRTPTVRAMVRETSLAPSDLIYPLFAVHGRGKREPIRSMPGIERFSVDRIGKEAREVRSLGIPAVLLFGIPSRKDPRGSGAWSEHGIAQEAIRAVKEAAPDLVVVADLCLCEYTSHGHCGVLQGEEVANDPTLELLARSAVSLARAGADWVAPSDMMDGRVGAIRTALDREGFERTVILSYAAKYASAFYGPFREAAESAPKSGDRKGYQMDPGNAREALREVRLDLEEGADVVMVKPALAYLDVIRAVRETFDVPVAAYNVSGEYSLVRAAAQRGWVDGEALTFEILTAIKRAGADLILTYAAREVARRLGA